MMKFKILEIISLNQIDRKKLENLFSFFFLLSRSAVEGMVGSERKETSERQQGAAERKRDNGAVGKKDAGDATEQIIAIVCSSKPRLYINKINFIKNFSLSLLPSFFPI
jgi:hypothetical protein